ncbi:hypothetical protein CDL12_16980 [Handroanthus impetiginosus]|uniref:Protein WUSCHEL n=1 Tax=Handroanthus impetiginosus TaxID=429701 RepID=A0A2G9GYS7_9LAMI|nr:hypothetical protein CDL12_16980 [Handroanthus impetiginosus]
MASSNRHWPSMFKSKPCNTTHHQWQNDHINSSLLSNGCHRTPYSSGPECEERTPEPKPRWNPRPEQIRILESIFNSGMVNPPRDEIRKIRVQLQEYGQVGDANVFYWFQNRKSRSKHKQRQLKSQQPQTTAPPPITTTIATTFTTAPSSSSSSDKSSPNNSSEKSSLPTIVIDLLNSPTASVNQPFFQGSSEFLSEPFFFPSAGGSNSANLTQGFCFPDMGNVADQSVFSELMLMTHCSSKKDEDAKMKLQPYLSYPVTTTPNTAQTSPPPPPLSVPSANNHNFQGAGETGPTKTVVFINDVCFEVGVGPVNVREAFGDDAVLIESSSGQPVLTNEWGITMQPLQHGAFYYLLRPFAPSLPDDRTMDLVISLHFYPFYSCFFKFRVD